MSANSSKENRNSLSTKWVLILFGFLFGWALCWSVDTFFVYFFLAGAVFSVFKIIQTHRSTGAQVTPSFAPSDRPDEPTDSESFLKNFSKSYSRESPEGKRQLRIVLFVVVGFTGFFIFLILVGIFGNLDTLEEDAFLYQQRAIEYSSNQQYDSAIYYYKLAIDNEPENATLWFERGNAFLNLQNTDSALAMYQKALAIDPTFDGAQYNVSYIYFDRKNYREAIQEAKRVLEYNPDYTDAKLLIGDSFYNQSQLDSALRWYEQAYQTGYRSGSLCHLMAYIYDVKGQIPTAIGLYKEALGQDSTIIEVYTRLGELVEGDEGNWFRSKAVFLKSERTGQ